MGRHKLNFVNSTKEKKIMFGSLSNCLSQGEFIGCIWISKKNVLSAGGNMWSKTQPVAQGLTQISGMDFDNILTNPTNYVSMFCRNGCLIISKSQVLPKLIILYRTIIHMQINLGTNFRQTTRKISL